MVTNNWNFTVLIRGNGTLSPNMPRRARLMNNVERNARFSVERLILNALAELSEGRFKQGRYFLGNFNL